MTPPTNQSPAKPTFEEVRAFLQQLHAKIELHDRLGSCGLVFKEDAKNKNRRALVGLSAMGIRPSDRRGYVLGLTPFDFCQGPFNDLDNPPPGKGDLWVFGRIIGKTDYYVKVQLGALSKTPVCVSFHEVEKPPLRRAFTV